MAVRHLYRAFPNREEAEAVAAALREQGVSSDRISVVARSPQPAGHEKEEGTKTEETLEAAREDNLATPLGAATAVGGAVAAASGVALGAGALMVAGPLLALLASAGALGATLGGFVGYLIGKGIPKEDLDELETTLKNNGAVLIVDSDSSVGHDEVVLIVNSFRAMEPSHDI